MKCPNCDNVDNLSNVTKCQCGYIFEGYQESTTSKNSSNIQNVSIKDIKIPFNSIVVFMIKWAIASVPALIILFTIGISLMALITSFSIVILNN